jgi:hypothetical protein
MRVLTWRAIFARRAWRIARHVIGCHFTEETKVQNALDDEVTLWGLSDIARHVIGCRLTEATRAENAFGDVVGNTCLFLPRPRHIPPRHGMTFDWRNEGSKCVH